MILFLYSTESGYLYRILNEGINKPQNVTKLKPLGFKTPDLIWGLTNLVGGGHNVSSKSGNRSTFQAGHPNSKLTNSEILFENWVKKREKDYTNKRSTLTTLNTSVTWANSRIQ